MPKPVLQAMVLADHVYQDRITGKFVIAGTFGTIFVGARKVAKSPESEKPTEQTISGNMVGRAGSPYLYFALVEVHGQTELELKYVDLSDASVLIEAQILIASSDPLAVSEYMVRLPELPADNPGHYSLDLLHDDEILGSWRIAVVKLPEQSITGDETNDNPKPD